MTHSALFNFGSRLVLANRDKTIGEFNRSQGLVERLKRPGSEAYHREICKIAAAAYAADGMEGSMQHQLFTKLAAADQWYDSYHRFTMPVVAALGKFAARSEELHKQASAVTAAGGVLAGAHQLPPILKLLLGVGAIGGVGAGSLGFLLSRDARESSADNNAITEKTRAYKQLRRDIEEDLAASGSLEAAPSGKQRYAL
jgi:hypothetical protein